MNHPVGGRVLSLIALIAIPTLAVRADDFRDKLREATERARERREQREAEKRNAQEAEAPPAEATSKQDDQDQEEASRKLTGEYSIQETAKGIDIGIGFPFLYENDVLTCTLHLCGTKIAGKRANFVQFKITNKREVAVQLRLESSLRNFSEPAVDTITVQPGKTVEIGQTPTFREVEAVKEGRPSATYVKISETDGPALYEKTTPVMMASRHDLPLDKKFFILMPVFVTPNDKAVGQLVSYAANSAPGRAIAGYQRPAQQVLGEIEAVYNAIAEQGVHYRSNTTSFLDASGGKVRAQRMTFPGESLEGTGANCVDGAFLFASAFENMGLKSAIIVVPGHAFVAVKTRKDGGSVFIETTFVGTRTFADAIREGAAKAKKAATEKTMFVVDVETMRKVGITPFPYDLGVEFKPKKVSETGQNPGGPQQPQQQSWTCYNCGKVFTAPKGVSGGCPHCGAPIQTR